MSWRFYGHVDMEGPRQAPSCVTYIRPWASVRIHHFRPPRPNKRLVSNVLEEQIDQAFEEMENSQRRHGKNLYKNEYFPCDSFTLLMLSQYNYYKINTVYVYILCLFCFIVPNLLLHLTSNPTLPCQVPLQCTFLHHCSLSHRPRHGRQYLLGSRSVPFMIVQTANPCCMTSHSPCTTCHSCCTTYHSSCTNSQSLLYDQLLPLYNLSLLLYNLSLPLYKLSLLLYN